MAGKIRTAQIGAGTVDMQFLGLAMVKQPQILPEFISAYAQNMPVTMLFSAIQPESTKEETLSSNQIKWQVQGAPNKIARIVRYSGTPAVGNRFQIVVNDGWFRHGAKMTLNNDRDQLYIDSDGDAVEGGIQYNAQVIGNVKGTMLDESLLAKNMPLNYDTASYEEGSNTGHPMPFGTGDWYQNAMSIERHKFSLTGDAITEALVFDVYRQDMKTGGTVVQSTWLPNILTKTGDSLLKFHMRARELNYHNSRSSYNPQTGEVMVKAGHNGNEDVLMGDGLLPQLEDAYTLFYDPLLDSPQYIRWCIRSLINYMSFHYDQDFIDLYVLGGRGARAVFSDAMADELNAATGNVTFRTPDSDGKMVAGLLFDSFRCDFGTAKFVLDNAFDDPSRETQKMTYNNLTLGVSSFGMYFLPVKQMPSGQNNIRMFSKGKTAWGQDINRNIVFGHIQGMSGYLGNKGMNGKQLGELSQYAQLVSTGRDAEQMEILSETMLIVTDPSRFARLLPYQVQ